MGGQPLFLEPRLESRLRSLLNVPGLLHTLTEALGSPLNVVVPDQLADNLQQFRSVYGSHHLSGQVYFAHKANRSSALLRLLAATDAGVDVASLGEMQHALGAGFTPTGSPRRGRRTRNSCGWRPGRRSPSASTPLVNWSNSPRWYANTPCPGPASCSGCRASRRPAYGC